MSRTPRARRSRTPGFASLVTMATGVALLASPAAAQVEPAPPTASRTTDAPAPAAPAPTDLDIAPRADGRAFSVCGTRSIDGVARAVSASIVEVEAPLWVSSGFVFGGPDLVVVPAVVVSTGRGIRVTHQGWTGEATVAAVDEAAGVAVLRVPGLEATPLAASPLVVERGTATIALGRPFGDDTGDVGQTSVGEVTATRGHGFHTSARVNFAADFGAPIVDCEGRVLGLSAWFADGAIATSRATTLIGRVKAGAPPYRGGLSLAPAIRMVVEVDRQAWVGGELGLSLVWDDRIEAGVSGRVLGHHRRGAPDGEGWSLDRGGVRGGADLRAGARLMVHGGVMPLYLVPHAGIGFDASMTETTMRRAQVESDGCSPEAPCGVVGGERRPPTVRDASVGPTVGLAARLGPIELGYTLRVDATDLERPTHQITFGAAF